MSRLDAGRPGSIPDDQVAAITPLSDHILGNGEVIVYVLFSGAVVLLLVAAVNLSGLLAARVARRGGEVALRLSLGASRLHLLRQFLAEGLVLATVGTIIGVGLAVAILDGVVALAPDGIARITTAAISGWSLLFAVVCLLFLTLGIGCVPLLLVREPSMLAVLRSNAAGVVGGHRAARIGGVLLTVEVTATVALLVIAGDSNPNPPDL